MTQRAIHMRLCVATVRGGYASQCFLQGEFVGQRATFRTPLGALTDTLIARVAIHAEFAAKGIRLLEQPMGQA